jgi:hypothetical protein
MKRLEFALCVALVLLVRLSPVRAQPLADRVPDDAILYVGWAGAESPGSAYAQSHLKAVLENCKIREFFSQFLPQVAQRIIKHEPDAEQPLNAIMTLAAPMWKYPSAVFFTGIEVSAGQPKPRFGLICRAGKDAEKVKAELDELLAMAGEPPFPVEAYRSDDLVGVIVGYDDPSKALAGGGPGAIKDAAAFTSALKHVQSDPMLVGYFDVEKLIGMVETIVQSEADEAEHAMFKKVLDASGFRGLKRIIHTAAFDGKDWMSHTFADVPMPRQGMLEVIDGKPISADLLKAVPSDATFVKAGRLDPARMIAQIKKVAGEVDPEFPRFVDMALGGAQLALAKNLQTDILEPLGSDWAMYCSPTVAGNGIVGLAIVNKLDDPAKAQASLPTAWINLSNWVAVALNKAEAEVEVRGRYTKIGDLTVYYLGVPIVAPSWAVKDGFLYMGLFPQSVYGATRSTAGGGKSIVENERFAALQKRLNVKEPCGFSFYDLQSTAAQGSMYQQLLVIARYAGLGDLFGVPVPEPMIPPLEILQQHLGPAGSAMWVDDAGVHEKSIAPFPGSKALSEPGLISSIGAAGPAFAAALVLPAIGNARGAAMGAASAANLRVIGQGVIMHAMDDPDRKFPPDLGTLVLKGAIPAEVFITPRTHRQLAGKFDGMSAEERAQWVNEQSDYVYLGNELTADSGSGMIVVYEKPEAAERGKVAVLYSDGHVEAKQLDEALAEIDAQLEARGLPKRPGR